MRASGGRQTYETLGTHLTDWGGYVAYRAIARDLGFDPVPFDQMEVGSKRDEGDLGGKVGSSAVIIHPSYNLRSPTAARVETPAAWSAVLRRPQIVMERSEPGPKAVIFRDSMAVGMVDLLAEHFSRSVFIWNKGYIYSDIIESERPDYVIHISTERFVSTFPTQRPTRRLIAFASVTEPSATV